MFTGFTGNAARPLKLLAFCLLSAGFLFIASFPAVAQQQTALPDSSVARRHSPRMAIVYSAVCPGLGQIYNKKYWKLPIIYGAGGAFAYFVGYNQLKYKKFRDAYENGNPDSPALIDGIYYDYEILPRGRDYYRRYRDLSALGLGLIYFLNIIDAMVDATFFHYDVSDDLSMQLEPVVMESPGMTAAVGLRISFGF